jgi:nitrogen fixation NifU-like protein
MEPMNFNFLQDHSDHYLEMAYSTGRRERIEHPDGYGKRTGDCGDTVEIYLSVNQGRIQSVSFQTDGCMNTSACANTVGELVEGKSVEAAWELTPEDVVDYLETLPSQNFHCAELAVGALYLALANYREHQRRPWKRLYAGK